MSVRRNSPVPLYVQIKDRLKEQIADGTYPVGSRLPSERELAQRHGVSRMTARQALQALAREGLTRSRTGTGTFVSPPRIDQTLWTLTSFSEEMWRRGMTPSSHVRRAAVIPAPTEIAAHLQIAPHSAIVLLARVRLANGRPLALEISHLPHRQCPGLLDRYDFSHTSLYRVLRQDYDLYMTWADQTIQAGLANEAEREALQLTRQTPVLRLSRITYDARNQPIEYVRSAYRGDEYQLRATLRQAQ